MKIIDILSSPWAIMPEKLEEIFRVYAEHIQGPKLNKDEIIEILAKAESEKKEGNYYEIVNRKAIIKISGMMMKNPDWIMKWIYDAMSMTETGKYIEHAANNPKIDVIILYIDSSGGTVDGIEYFGEIIFQARQKKPIIAFTDGIMASAAMWAGRAAHEIYINGETAVTGSIGVATYHIDASKFYKDWGIKITDIYAGKYKRISTATKPLSKEGKDYIQSQVDTYYKIFVDTVARNRGVPTEKVLNNMADGKIFIGSEAVKNGLIDGVLSIKDIIAMDVNDINTDRPNKNIKLEEKTKVELTLEILKKDYPTIYDQAKAETKAEVEKNNSNDSDKIKSDAKAEGIKVENERVKGIYALNDFGHSDEKKQCIENINISVGDAAIKFNQAQATHLDQKQKDLNADAVPAIEHADTPAIQTNKKDTKNMTLEEKAQHDWDNDESVKKDFTDFDSYLHFKKNESNVSINGGK